MSRLKADSLLLFVALVWGAAFVAQKNAMADIGVLTFVAARFALSALLLLPLAWREQRGATRPDQQLNRSHLADFVILCGAFTAADILQQAGIARTSVTNAGFLTGLYVLFVPIICRIIYREKLSRLIFPAALLSVAGVWLLSGGITTALNGGDAMVLLCAIGYATQVTLIGRLVRRVSAPLRICFIQYAVVAVISTALAFIFEQPTLQSLWAVKGAILYAGGLSGGVAYTLQVLAQQHTPASDSAVILSSESVFAALAGAALLQERLSAPALAGCGLIIIAILLVEFGPYIGRWRRNAANPD